MAGVTAKTYEDVEEVPDSKLTAFFDSATNNLVAVHDGRPPEIDQEQKQFAVGIAHELGVRDGRRPGAQLETTKVILPSEEVLTNHAHAVLDRIGSLARPAIQLSKQGKLLTWREPQPRLGVWQRLLSAVRENLVTILIVVISAVIEYIVGIQVTQRIFDANQGEAHVLAIGIAALLGIGAITAAVGIHHAAPGSVKKLLGVLGVTVVIEIIIFALLAGSVLSGIVAPATSGGISGGGATAGSARDSGLLFKLVAMGAYVFLFATLFTSVLIAHFRDMVRAEGEMAHRAHAARQGVLPEDRVAAVNAAYLQVFVDLYHEVVSARRDVISSYVKGVRSTLEAHMAGSWDGTRILTPPAEPAWVAELQREIDYADRRAATSS